jgi:hypothetical protein
MPYYGLADLPTITITPASPGITIPLDFVGISFETSYITLQRFNPANVMLANAIGSFGANFSVRIGGNTSDTQVPSDARIDDMATFIAARGCKLLYGLPGRTIAPSVSTAEQAVVDAAIAARIAAIAGTSNVTFQVENEPNFSGVSYATFETRWQTIKDAVVASVPAAKFAGCGDGTSTISRPTFLLQFAPSKGSQVEYFTLHRYGGVSGQQNPALSLPSLIANDQFMCDRQLINNSSMSAKKIRIAECGGLGGGSSMYDGQTLGATVWNMRLMAMAAEAGWLGVNFHNPEHFTNGYAPLRDLAGGVGSTNPGYIANPGYYSMKLFHTLVGGRVIPCASPLGVGYTLGVLGADGKARVLVINPNLRTGLNLTIASGTAFTTASAIALTGDGYADRNGVTVGGAQMNANGSMTLTPEEIEVTDDGTAILTLPPASSVVVTLDP